MALLDLVQRVCDEVGLPRPIAVATSTDQLARQMFSLANAELEELSKRYNWPQLTREYTFLTVANTAAYALPANYRKFLSDTVYNADSYFALRGSVAPVEWQRYKQLNASALYCARVRIFGHPLMLNVLPVPSSTNNVVFEYVTKNFAVNAAGVEILRYAADDDVAIVDEALLRLGLKWRIKHAKGLEFSADLAEYEAVVAREYAAAMAAPALDVGYGNIQWDAISVGSIPANGFGDDPGDLAGMIL